MAGDWIPWQKGLTRKTEVWAIANATAQERRWVAATLMEFWEWCDAELTDGLMRGLSLDNLPSLIEGTTREFWQAVVSVGWLRVAASGLVIPHFERWLGRSAKRRLQSSERQRVSRSERDKNVTPVLSCPVPPSTSEVESGGAGGCAPSQPPLECHDDAFAAFWAAYPKKVARRAAQRQWRALDPSRELAATIAAAVKRQVNWTTWRNGYIANPANWLADHRWDDEEPLCTQNLKGPARVTPTKEETAAKILAQRKADADEKRNAGDQRIKHILATIGIEPEPNGEAKEEMP